MPAKDLQQHLGAAVQAARQGATDQARADFQAALKIDPREATARNWLGADALARGDAQSALIHFKVASEQQPRERSHWINLASAYRALDDSEAERRALESALSIDQTDLLGLVRMAELHERLHEEASAAERWAAVLGLSMNIQNPSAEFAAILQHAREFISEQRAKLCNALDAALAEDSNRASARDKRRMRAAADVWLGRRSIYTNHCEGLHYPFLPADEFFDLEHFPWLGELEAATDMIAAELQAISDDAQAELTPYISLPPGVPANIWSPLDKSLDWGAFHLWKEGHRFDEACARAPGTAALVETLPICRIEGKAPNIFFSILKAGAHIPPHTGVTNVRSVVHLPLVVPEGCAFRVGGETRKSVVGEAFAFDDTIEHEAWNGSEHDRAVLIIDAWNPHLSEHEREMVCRMYEAMDASRGRMG